MSNTIGQLVQLMLPQFHKELEGKVDTGATTCCMHGIDIKIDKARGEVSFTNPALSSNVIRVPLISQVDVHSANSDPDPRPIVEFAVSIQQQNFERVQFNINDRSNMDSKVLIGQNLLKLGDFVVDISEAEVEVSPVEADIELTPITDTSPTCPPGQLTYNREDDTFTIGFTRQYLLNILNSIND